MDQLKCLLVDPRFKKAGNPSDFLTLTVKRAMAGTPTPGRIIAKELFGPKYVQGVSRDVRVTSNSLRKLLKQYYGRGGSDDPVIIDYPEPSKDPTIKPVEGQAYPERRRGPALCAREGAVGAGDAAVQPGKVR